MPEAAAPVIGAPHMSVEELELFRQVLAEGHRRYAEFGTGGSTLEAVRSGFDTVVAVDSDRNWVQALSRHDELRPAIRAGRLSILHGQIGPTGAWGGPVGTDTMKQWPNYVATQWKAWAERGESPDLLFVDGRFRVACALSALLACPDAPPRLMMHDMLPERLRGYGAVLEFYEAEAKAQSLWVLRPLPRPDPMRLLTAFLRHLLTFG
ncbi:hypothetical protein [Teichococcus oryzae]|uniref:Class I SAM-dependent methyltransferase n=1 Tax=Teichococcus oryzae TaxID=1608942 RepID=A0A5B2TH08_9PROT|nr:hypothetical protein [Pseudoroseomonas oryzae]KAA2213767.1 hypothetical protein F0Q34_06805 [Pseudoroseomonas oryzae]